MSSEKYLKNKNTKFLWVFIVFNVLLFWVVFALHNTTLNNIELLWENWSIKNITVALLAPIITFVMNGLLNSNIKAILVFWKIKDPLPGCRAFSLLAYNDPRINIEALKEKLGKFPENPREQNQTWFRLYKKHKTLPTVEEPHSHYLLSRDLTGLGVIFLIVFSIAMLFVENLLWIKGLYLLYLVVQYIILAIVARNYGNRFVCNVLAEESI